MNGRPQLNVDVHFIALINLSSTVRKICKIVIRPPFSYVFAQLITMHVAGACARSQLELGLASEFDR